MKILIAADSFKGTLSSREACGCIKAGIEKAGKYETATLPLADGGEGFGECLCNHCKGDILNTQCTDIYGKRIDARIYTFGNTAIIESAEASGLQKIKRVMSASSYGTGELINQAVSMGYSDIILGLGGSGCCDGGIGALAALGAEFKDINGMMISRPTGADMENIYGVSFRNIVKHINFTFACDVDNEYYGKNGAAYVFAPQKGANRDDVIHLDDGLKRVNAFLPNDIRSLKGAGAAGGICGGLYSVYGGEIKSGFDILADASSLEEEIKNADIVITGEGKTDRQTLMGKLVYKISELCKKHAVKCVVISGLIDGVEIGNSMFSVVGSGISQKQAMENAKEYLIMTAEKAAISNFS